MLNELLQELHELKNKADETPCQRIMREYAQKNCEGNYHAIANLDGEPYFVPTWIDSSSRGADGDEAGAYRIKCNGELDTIKRAIVCKTYPDFDPEEPDDYEWNLLPLDTGVAE